jgi:hypothetical protein
MTQMSHYTYFLTAKEPYQGMKYYIGVRSCNGKPEEDSYVCSSKVIKRNKIKVSKQVLAVWSSRKEAESHEILLHDCFDVARNKEFFNQAKHTSTGFNTAGQESSMKGKKHTLEAIEKMKVAHRNQAPMKGKKHSKETKEKIRITRVGKKHTAETNEKIRLANLGKKREPLSQEAKDNLRVKNLGKTVSAETKQKISSTSKGRNAWNKGLKGGTSWNKGMKMTPEHCESIRLGILKRKQYVGY